MFLSVSNFLDVIVTVIDTHQSMFRLVFGSKDIK